MKKLVSIFACLFMFLSIPMEGVAESGQAATRHYIDEVGISLLLPKNMTVVTRDSPAKKRDYYYPDMIEQDAYLYALAEDNSYDVIVSVIQDKEFKNFGDLNSKEDEELLRLYKEFFKQPNFEGMFASQSPIYKTAQKTFLVFDCYQETEDGLVNARLYFTIHEDKAVIFALNSLSGGYDNYKSSLLQQIASSMDFGFESKFESKIKYPLVEKNNDLTLIGILLAVVALVMGVVYLCSDSESQKAQEKTAQYEPWSDTFEDSKIKNEGNPHSNLIMCPECGGQISKKATDCVHCGYPLQKKKKKDDSAWPYLWWMWMSQNNDDMWMSQDSD